MDAVTLALASKVNNKIIQEKVIDNFDAVAADEIIAVNNEIEKLNNALEDAKDVLSAEIASIYNSNLAILDANVNDVYEDINIKVDDILESLPDDLSTTLAAVGNSLESRAGAIKCEAEGHGEISVKDSSNNYLRGLRIFGRTDVTIALNQPKSELSFIGEKGLIYIQLINSKGNYQLLTFPLAEPLCGVRVSSGGNYIDNSGQQWIADEINFEKGVLIKRTALIESYNGETITTPYISDSELSPGARVVYVIDPIEIPLSPTIIYSFNQLKTYYPTTTIVNDESADMVVKYNADTKTYIQNKIVDLSTLYLNSK